MYETRPQLGSECLACPCQTFETGITLNMPRHVSLDTRGQRIHYHPSIETEEGTSDPARCSRQAIRDERT